MAEPTTKQIKEQRASQAALWAGWLMEWVENNPEGFRDGELIMVHYYIGAVKDQANKIAGDAQSV